MGRGGPYDQEKVVKEFQAARRRAKLPAFRLMDLRHTYASILLTHNAPLLYVSQQMGHASPTTTLKYYARWIRGDGRSFVVLLDTLPAIDALPTTDATKRATNTHKKGTAPRKPIKLWSRRADSNR